MNHSTKEALLLRNSAGGEGRWTEVHSSFNQAPTPSLLLSPTSCPTRGLCKGWAVSGPNNKISRTIPLYNPKHQVLKAPKLCFQHLPLRPRQVKVIMRGGCWMIKKDPVAADDAGNTSSLVDLHPRQWPPATHLLHYDPTNNIILRVFLHFSKVISTYCLHIKVKT